MIRLSPADPQLQASYLDALRELTAEGNAHFLAMVHPPEPGYAGADFTLETARRPRRVRGVLCPHGRARAARDAPARRLGDRDVPLDVVDDDAGRRPDLAAARADALAARGGRPHRVRRAALRPTPRRRHPRARA